MSMTIGTTSGLRNPAYSDGWERTRRRIGGDWLFLDGTRGRHHVGAAWAPRFTWRVTGSNYTNLIAALTAADGAAVTVSDDFGTSGTFLLASDVRDTLIAEGVHEVTAEFVSV